MNRTIDLINGGFELFGAVAIWGNVRRLWLDREVKGIDWKNIVFFWTWGLWNCFYYPALGQYLSFYAGAILALGNTIWVGMYVYMRWKKLLKRVGGLPVL